jgi:hypothetical protein
MKYVAAAVVALIVYAVLMHYIAKFCGFNQLPKEGEHEYS